MKLLRNRTGARLAAHSTRVAHRKSQGHTSTGSSWGDRVPPQRTLATHHAASPQWPGQRPQPSFRSRPGYLWLSWESSRHIFDWLRPRSSQAPSSFHRNRCSWTLAVFGMNRVVAGTSGCLKSASPLRGWPHWCEFSEAARAKCTESMRRARSSYASQGGSSPAMAILPSCHRQEERRSAMIRTTATFADKSSAMPSPMSLLLSAYFLLKWVCRWILDALAGIITRSALGCAVAWAPGSLCAGFVSLPTALG